MAEQCFCKAKVGGSTPLSGLPCRWRGLAYFADVVQW